MPQRSFESFTGTELYLRRQKTEVSLIPQGNATFGTVFSVRKFLRQPGSESKNQAPEIVGYL